MARIAQRDKPALRVAGAQQRHGLARQAPFLESHRYREVVGAAEVRNANLLAGKLGRLADLFLCHKAEGKFVQSGGDDDQVRSLAARAHRRRGR